MILLKLKIQIAIQELQCRNTTIKNTCWEEDCYTKFYGKNFFV